MATAQQYDDRLQAIKTPQAGDKTDDAVVYIIVELLIDILKKLRNP